MKTVNKNHEYLKALKALKASFVGGKDKTVVAEAISRHLQRRLITLLDVGTGDGSYLRKLRRVLETEGFQLQITGIDPLLKDPGETRTELPDANLEDVAFEEFRTEYQFDVVHVRQSLYYMEDLHSALDRLLSLTASSGLLIVNVWSEKCILYKMHCETQGTHAKREVTAENIYKILCEKTGLDFARVTYCRGKVKFDEWSANDDVFNAAYGIISRNLKIEGSTAAGKTQLRQTLNHLGSEGTRVNGLVFVKILSD